MWQPHQHWNICGGRWLNGPENKYPNGGILGGILRDRGTDQDFAEGGGHDNGKDSYREYYPVASVKLPVLRENV
jgi:hypothetical protein